MMYNLSTKMRNEVKGDIIEESSLPSRKNIRIDDTTLTICLKNYSLKGKAKSSVWTNIVPEKYVSATRGIVSVFTLGLTIAAIYGIVIMIMQYKE